MQRNWIGRSEGIEVSFPLEGMDERLECFTTRVDTIYGATFIAIAADHPLSPALLERGRVSEGTAFLQRVRELQVQEREKAEFTKEGFFSGCYAMNPANGRRIPVYLASYVLMEYGTGVVMGVPAHDQRDFEFAGRSPVDIPVVQVISPNGAASPELSEAYTADGRLLNSEEFDGLDNRAGMERIAAHLAQKGLARAVVHYRLKDWLISRQRYWGGSDPRLSIAENAGLCPCGRKTSPCFCPKMSISTPGDGR